MTKISSDKIIQVRRCLKNSLLNDTNCESIGIEQRRELYATIERTVTFGQSDSVLVVGPRGSGKSLLVNSSLQDIAKNVKDRESYIVVHLNGLIHTNDNLALKDIIRQLHVDEIGDGIVTGSFADNLVFVLQSLQSGSREASKAIVFILDEFQLFCGHRNQTLLYNLFDIAQSAQAPICIVGLTCRIDVTEMLEKRVKSRFSHRIIYVFSNNELEERLSQIRNRLILVDTQQNIKTIGQSFICDWNKNVEKILKEAKIVRLIRRQLEIDPSQRKFKNLILLLTSTITETSPRLTSEIFEQVLLSLGANKKVELLKDLSVLELCVVIAALHHHEIYDREPFNFEMVLKQYLKFASRNYSVVTPRPILFKAFERLKDIEVIIPLSQGKNCKKEYQLYSLLVTSQEIKEAIVGFQGLPTDVAQWANSSVNSL